METACAFAVCIFNDGTSSLSGLSNCLGLHPTNLAQKYLKQKDRKRLAESQYKKRKGKEATPIG